MVKFNRMIQRLQSNGGQNRMSGTRRRALALLLAMLLLCSPLSVIAEELEGEAQNAPAATEPAATKPAAEPEIIPTEEPVEPVPEDSEAKTVDPAPDAQASDPAVPEETAEIVPDASVPAEEEAVNPASSEEPAAEPTDEAQDGETAPDLPGETETEPDAAEPKPEESPSVEAAAVVPVPVESIAFEESAVTLKLGETCELKAKILPEGAKADPTWSTSDEGVAVCENGQVRAMGYGTAEIVCAVTDEIRAVCKVTVVRPAVEAIIPQRDALVLGVKETASVSGWKLQPEGAEAKVAYATSNKKIAAVDANGKVTAKKAGKAVITISTDAGPSCKVAVTVRKAPSSVKLSIPRKTLAVGETVNAKASLSSKSASALTFASSDASIVTIDESGKVTAVAPGQAAIGVWTFNKKKSIVNLTIVPAPTSVSFPQSSVQICAGTKAAVAASVNSGSAGTISYRSSDETIIAVNASTGEVSALREGKATVTATTYNGLTAECALTVLPAPTAVRLNAPSTVMGLKEKMALSCTIDPENAVCAISYSTSNKKIATVDANGVVTAKKTGKVTITAKTYNGVKASVKITVRKAPSSVKLSIPRKTLAVGETVNAKASLSSKSASALTFASSDASIVTIDESGKVTAVAPGQASIGVWTFNKKKSIVNLTIVPAPTSVSFPQSSVQICAGTKAAVAASVNSGSAGTISYRSSDESIIAVNASTGEVSALREGKATVTATTYNGLTAECALTVLPAPTAVRLNAPSTVMGLKEKMALSCTIDPEDAVCAISYSTSNKKIATVDANGVVTAKKTGKVTITAKTYNGVKASVKITVRKAPSSVKLSIPRKTLAVGETVSAKASLSSKSASALTFASSDASIVTIDESGKVTAIAPGQAAIGVWTFNKKKSIVNLTIVPAPTSVSFPQSSVQICAGTKATVAASVNSGSAGTISYRSSDESIIAVNASTGEVSALREGKATVTATTYNGLTTECALTVLPAPTAVRLNAPSTVMGLKEKMALSCTIDPENAVCAISYSTSNKKIATVDANGVVTAKKTGKVTITAKTYNGVKASVKITVKKAPSKVAVRLDRSALGVGETGQAAVSLPKNTAGAFVLESLNPEVATVDTQGKVSALAPGQATIAVVTYNGKKASVVLTVKPAPTSVEAPDALKMGAGQTSLLAAAVNSESAGKISFSSNSECVSVDSNGWMTAQSAGTAVITSTAYNGVSTTTEVTVLAAPTHVSLGMSSITLGLGDSIQLNPVVDEGAFASYAYASSKKKIASVSQSGLVKAVRTGKSVISVKTYNGKVAKLKVTVVKAPSSVVLSQSKMALMVGQTQQIYAKITKKTATTLSLSISDETIASVDDSGKITGLAPGSAILTVSTHNGKKATCAIQVMAPPDHVTLNIPEKVCVGQLAWVTAELPENTFSELTFSITEGTAASITDNGLLMAQEAGTVTVRVSTNIPDVWAEKTVTIHPASDSDFCLIMPERRTDVDSIGDNLKRIECVEASAYRSIEILYRDGAISKAEYDKRISTVKNAFVMYKFPWMTPSTQKYWKAANSEGGAKNYKPGVVYYGLPYTQTRRTYNVKKALKENRYVDSGEGYYVLNQKNLAGGTYCGNDCSAFVSMAIWGMNSGHSDDTTGAIGKTKDYKKISYDKLRSGDILNKSYAHVVMFLYWTDETKTQMVIIEQGGSEPAINTCSTSIRPVEYYKEHGYVPLRLAALG